MRDEETFERNLDELVTRTMDGRPVEDGELRLLDDLEGACDDLEDFRDVLMEMLAGDASAHFASDVVDRVEMGEEVSDDELEGLYAEYSSFDILDAEEY